MCCLIDSQIPHSIENIADDFENLELRGLEEDEILKNLKLIFSKLSIELHKELLPLIFKRIVMDGEGRIVSSDCTL